MSYRNINDKATVRLFVNGEQAKEAMERLKKTSDDLKKSIQEAKDAGKLKEANKLQRELDKVTRELNRTESAAKGTGIVLNDLSNTSIYGLRNSLKYLQRELSMTKPDSEAWHRYSEQIQRVQDRINELNGELEEQRSLWDRFKGWADTAWPALDLLRQWGSGIVDIARGAVDAFAEMDQEMANVRKFTGMGAEDVAALNEEFKKMDTRTSREDLNKLAQEAGRLGKTSPEDIMGFVRAADKVNVALDDLGEGATLTLSKLTGVFGYEQMYGTEQSLLKVGSVINELSQNCSASAPYLADFASRMGGVGAQANMTIPQIMAFGAVLDANGQQVEASSTALSQVIVRMMQEPAKYAKVAGLDVKKFSDMLKTDVNGALIMFLETLQKAGGMDVLSPMFKDMGENGSRAISALSTLATHIDEVKAQQEAANVAFKEGTSIDKEFSVQNTTVQASLDKAKKAANDLRIELGEKLSPVMSHIISSSTALIRVMMTVVRFMLDQKVTIMMLAVAMITYYTVINVATIKTTAMTAATKAWAVLCKALPATMALVKVAVAALTNSVQYFTNGLQVNYAMQLRWRNALNLMAAAGGAKIFIAITTAALALSQVLVRLIANHQAHVRALQTLNNIRQQAIGQVEEEKFKLQQLMKAASDVNATEEKRLEICNKLNETVPNMRANIDKLTGAFIYSKDAVDEYVKSLTHLYEIQGAKDKLKELGKKRADLTVKKTKLEDERQKIVGEQSQYASNASGNFGYTTTSGAAMPSFALTMTGFSGAAERLDMNLKSVNRDLQELDEQSKLIYKTYGVLELMSDGPKQDFNPSVDENAGTGYTSLGAGSSGSRSGAEDRFVSEKVWKDKEEALARISYAKGESDYEEYTIKMSQIQVDYNQKLLDRTDVSGTERLKIQADYWETTNKYIQAQHTQLVSIENASYEESVRALNEAYAKKLEAGNMSAEESEAAEKSHQEALELAELEHLKRLTVFTKGGSEERNKAEQQYLDARLRAAQRHQQEYEKAQQEHEKRLASFKDKYFGLNATEKQAAYDADIATLTEVYNAEIIAAGNNADEKLRIEEAFQAAKLALQKQYGLLAEEDNRNAMQRAIDSSVEWLNGDGGKALTGTLNTLVSGMSSIFSGLSSMMQAELEIQTAAIKKRYDAEIDRAQGNSYRIRKLEKQRDAEQAKAKKEANRKMFALQVIQAVAQTATNALNAYGSAAAVPVVGYILAPIAAAMAVAAGAIQIAAIKKQQQASESQGFSKGGFTKPGAVNEPAGIVHAGEWVASQKLLATPVARPMIEALDYAQRTNTIGSLKDEDVSRSIRATDSMVRMAESDGSSALMVAAVVQNAEAMAALNERLKQPIDAAVSIAGEHGFVQAEDKYNRYLKNKSPKDF